MSLFEEALDPRPIGAFSSGIATSAGVSIGQQAYDAAPNISGNAPAAGTPVVTARFGRQEVVIGTRGFHTP